MASRVLSLGKFLGPAAEAVQAASFQAALEYSTVGGVAAYKLPDLPYAYSALEPIISAEIMELHYSKHHAGYVANLNKALEEYADAEAKRNLQKMIALQGAINFNGGGAFWPQRARERRRAWSRAHRAAAICCALLLLENTSLSNTRVTHATPPTNNRPHQPRHLLDQPGASQGLPAADRRPQGGDRRQVGQPRQVHGGVQRADGGRAGLSL